MKTILKKIIVLILTLEAKAVLARFKPKIVAITGSVGKTSAKDAIAVVLTTKFSTRKSEKSFNSEIGAPLTILGLPNGWSNPLAWLVIMVSGALCLFRKKYPEWLVLEIGADRPDDIKKLASWIKPDAVVITRFAKVPVHIEFFASPRQIIEEKMNLARALKEDGVLILNGDDDDILEAQSEIRRPVTTYGFNLNVNIRASDEKVLYEETGNNSEPVGMISKVTVKGKNHWLKIDGVMGRQIVYAALAAIAVADSQGIEIAETIEALRDFLSPPGRMKILKGIKNSLIIDDTYNSSPVALEEALLTLKNLSADWRTSPPTRWIAVLGDMLELGKHSTDEHKKAGALAGGFVDLLVTVGKRADGFAEGALAVGLAPQKIVRLENSREAGKYLDPIITSGDIILIKGSQGMRMEKVVEKIMAEPENKEKVLVRQDKEWQKR